MMKREKGWRERRMEREEDGERGGWPERKQWRDRGRKETKQKMHKKETESEGRRQRKYYRDN